MKKSKKIHLIVLAVIIIIIAIISVVVVIHANRTKETSADEIENLENILEENTIDENIIEENIINIDDNKAEENETNNTSNTNQANVSNSAKYYIKINNEANVVTIYTKDSNGNYTTPVKAMVCSTGTSTPENSKHKIPGGKGRWGTLFGHTPGTYVYGQYTTTIVGNILFHSVPYTKNGDPSSLEYSEYDKLGTRASAGCIRLTVQDAKWIYDNISAGTIVEFYRDTNPGPLGKPSAKKISSYPDSVKNWDPTDSTSNNPWKTYKEHEQITASVIDNASNQQENTKNETEELKNTVAEEFTNSIKNDVQEVQNIVSNNTVEINNSDQNVEVNDI